MDNTHLWFPRQEYLFYKIRQDRIQRKIEEQIKQQPEMQQRENLLETIPEKTDIWGQVNNPLEKRETRNEFAIASDAMEGQTELIETHLKAETFTYYPPIFV